MTDQAEPEKRWWEAHYSLERQHTELVKRVDLHSDAIKQLVDQQKDDHHEVMAGINRVENHIYQRRITPVQAIAYFCVVVFLFAILIGIYTH